MTDSKQKSQQLTAEQKAAEQLTEIRELLFGQQVQGIESTLEKTKQSFTKRLEEINQAFQSELQDLIHEFNQSLSHLEARHQELNEHTDGFHHQFDQALKALQDTQQAQDSQHTKALEKTVADLQAQIDFLSKQLEEKHQLALDKIQQTNLELSDNKADRKTLANLLATMATNLES